MQENQFPVKLKLSAYITIWKLTYNYRQLLFRAQSPVSNYKYSNFFSIAIIFSQLAFVQLLFSLHRNCKSVYIRTNLWYLTLLVLKASIFEEKMSHFVYIMHQNNHMSFFMTFLARKFIKICCLKTPTKTRVSILMHFR